MSSSSGTGGLCEECDGRGPSSGGGAHGSGDPGCQRAPESNCEEQQSGAHSLQHSPALPSYHSCQQEEQTPHRYLPWQSLSLCLPVPLVLIDRCIDALKVMQPLVIS